MTTEMDAFCRDIWPRLAASFAYYCHDRTVGEEIAQEALARVCARWGHVARLDAPEAWAFRAGLNLARSRGRRKQAEQRALARLRSVAPSAPGSDADAIAVRDAVAALPERQRAAIVLRYFADLSVDQAATAMRCAPGTVKSLTSQAMERLRAALAVDEDDEMSEELR